MDIEIRQHGNGLGVLIQILGLWNHGSPHESARFWTHVPWGPDARLQCGEI